MTIRLVLDYGGTIVDHGDVRERAELLGVDSDDELARVGLAYFAFRDGFVGAYLDRLGTLTGASREACRAYLDRRWLDPTFPESHADLLHELADDHALVPFSNGVRPWIETVSAEHGVRDAFDDLVVSSDLRRAKPHPKGYLACLPETDERVVMVSDEYDEDLLTAETLGMGSVWLERDAETPSREPDARIASLTDLPSVLPLD